LHLGLELWHSRHHCLSLRGFKIRPAELGDGMRHAQEFLDRWFTFEMSHTVQVLEKAPEHLA
jgi:hypothetical protein